MIIVSNFIAIENDQLVNTNNIDYIAKAGNNYYMIYFISGKELAITEETYNKIKNFLNKRALNETI